MTEGGWRLKPLGPEDCDELGHVHMAIWRDAYAGLMPADYLAGLSDERCADNWRERTAEPTDGAGRTLVVVDPDGHVAGFGSAGPSRDEDAPTEWELYAVNLVPQARGTGVADRLLDELVGDRAATLWVVEGNARARAFTPVAGSSTRAVAPRIRRPGHPRSGWSVASEGASSRTRQSGHSRRAVGGTRLTRIPLLGVS